MKAPRFAMLLVALVLALSGVAHAQGAGDNQYQDPFAGKGGGGGHARGGGGSGASRALGAKGPITSPTFTIGRRYRGDVPVAHVDLYRLDGLEGEDPALLADYLGPDLVTFLEWPERAGAPAAAVEVRLEHLGGD